MSSMGGSPRLHPRQSRTPRAHRIVIITNGCALLIRYSSNMQREGGETFPKELPADVMLELSVDQMFSWTVGRNVPVAAGPPLRKPQELMNPPASIRLAYTLQEVLRNTDPDEKDRSGVMRSWQAMNVQLNHCLSDEGKRQLAHTVSDRCPDSARCARIEMTAVLGWLDPLIGELSLAD